MASFEHLHAEVKIESLSQERRGPGLGLRQARERCRLTVAAVANTLHLEQGVIEALEADDYAHLPPITYVRGYLSAYARLVNLPVTDVLQAFERVGLEERSRPLTSKVGRGGNRGMTGFSAGSSWLLTAAFTAVLVSGWMFWIESQSSSEAAAQSEDEIGAGASASAIAAELGTDRVPAPAGGPGADVSASVSVPEGLTAPTKTALELSSFSGETAGAAAHSVARRPPNGSLSMAANATAGNTNTVFAQTPPQNPPVASAASSAAESTARSSADVATTANAESMPARPAGALETLKVDATGESWVDVQDASGQRLVYALLERGDSRQVTGQPPFAITIGDGTQVMLRHDGAPVDLDPYMHGKVARFTLTAARD